MVNRMKKNLIYAFSLLSCVGLAFAGYPFISSLRVNEKAMNSSIHTCSVIDMQPGEIIECGLVSIYRRTELDKAHVKEFAYLLSDPQSTHSEQPKGINKLFRSTNIDYFIFYPWAPKRGCGVTLKGPQENLNNWDSHPELEALQKLPYFTEPCEGRAWDMSGRLYHREGYPQEYNLKVPNAKWVSENSVRLN
jgi:hypothetical protein